MAELIASINTDVSYEINSEIEMKSFAFLSNAEFIVLTDMDVRCDINSSQTIPLCKDSQQGFGIFLYVSVWKELALTDLCDDSQAGVHGKKGAFK